MALAQKYVTVTGFGGGGDGSAAMPWTLDDAILGAAPGDVVNVASGTYARTTTADVLPNGTITSPIAWRGYKTTIGDLSPGGSLYSRTNSNGGRVTTNMPLITYTTGGLAMGGKCILESLNFSGAPSGPLITPSAGNVIMSCVITNSSTNAAAAALAIAALTSLYIVDNDILLSGASGGAAAVTATTSTSAVLAYNRIKGGAAPGITLTTGVFCIIGNVIYRSNSTAAIVVSGTTGAPKIIGNTIVNQGGTGDGINIVTSNTVVQCILNNLITDNAGYGLNMVSASNGAFAAFNRFRDNTLGNVNLGTDWLAATSYGHVTSGNGTTDFSDASTDDYRLVASSPAKGTGIQPYADIGAGQRQESSGGSAKLGLSI